MRRLLLAAAAIATLTAACGDDSGSAASTPDASVNTTGCVAPPPRTCAAVTAAFATAGPSATISCDSAAGTFTMRATGVPPYTSNQSTPNAIDDQGWVVTLPLAPTCAASPTSVVASRGPIGFMLNGVAFYGPQNANGQDAPTVEGATLDDCDGHADMMCTYHYHSRASCVFGRGIPAGTEDDGHPALIGFALDGFALYAAQSSVVLDACNGHSDARRGYHYHATATSPYFVGCTVGTAVVPQATDRGCT